MGSLAWIAIGWVGLDVLILAYLVQAGRPRTEDPLPERHVVLTTVLTSAVLVASLVATVLESRARQWQPPELAGLLASLALASDLIPVRTAFFRVSGSFMALMLALVTLGAAPAVTIGVVGTLLDAVRSRPHRVHVLSNLAAYASFPLVGALALRQLGTGALAVFGISLGLSMLNFVMVGGCARLLHGGSVAVMLRRTWLPVLPWEVATAAAVALTTLASQRFGPAAVAALALALVGLQILLRSLLHRAARVREFAA